MTTVPRPLAPAQVPLARASPDDSLRQRADFLFRAGPSPLYRPIVAYRARREPPP